MAHFEGSMMEKQAIGKILKDRIKECRYNQEDFAEKVGISYDSLRNYIDGTSMYPVELLIKFAEELECSFDYLLGYSKATKNENHILVNELGLSNDTIEVIKGWNNCEITDIRENLLHTLDKIICKEGFIYELALFILSNKRFVSLGSQYTDSIINEPMDEIGLDVQKQLFLGAIFATLGELREECKGEIVISEETLQALEEQNKE